MAPVKRRKSSRVLSPIELAASPSFSIRELDTIKVSTTGYSSLLSTSLDVLKQTFLPEGFPQSTPHDYLEFQAWDSIQALCSYVRGMLCTQAVMRGIGVGSDQATAYGAVFMFAVRDLTGMIGGLIFSHAQGSGFDTCAKQWRLFADVTNDLAMALDLASPLFPKAFLLIACIGSVMRALTSVAGGATRAALTQHFSRSSGKAADVAAKEQSQETAVTIVGMVIGIILTKICKESQGLVWTSFILLTWLHIWANVKAVRSLVLISLNRPRLDAILLTLVRDETSRRDQSRPGEGSRGRLMKGKVISPDRMKSIEGLVPPPLASILRLLQALFLFARDRDLISVPEIQMGVSLSWLKSNLPASEFEDFEKTLQDQRRNDRYLVVMVRQAVNKGRGEARQISSSFVILRKDFTQRDIVLAYCHAFVSSILDLSDDSSRGLAERCVGNMEREGWDVDGRNSIQAGKFFLHDW